jgi:hypothetical protein
LARASDASPQTFSKPSAGHPVTNQSAIPSEGTSMTDANAH